MNKDKVIKNMEGIVGIDPRMKKVDFDNRNIIITLEDGRVLSVPLKYYPSIKKLKPELRKKYHIFEYGKYLNILASDEIYHIQDFLGIPEDYLRKIMESAL